MFSTYLVTIPGISHQNITFVVKDLDKELVQNGPNVVRISKPIKLG